jgi:Leishmanolysin
MKSQISILASALVLASTITACGGSNSSSNSNTSTATADNPLAQYFPKSTSVFGTLIVGTAKTSDESMIHAANVMAQYLDNNEDGIADNPAVVEHLKTKGATLLMAANSAEIESLFDKLPENDAYQDLYSSEVIVGDSANLTNGEFDATLEEVLHLISHVGYAGVYPSVFGESIGSVLADAMDVARGGQFETIPANYPASAWYTYDDETCDYSCMATEYFYWSLTSILGAQDGAGRLAQINQEWTLNTKDLVQQKDTLVFDLLTDSQYRIPTQLPNGDYGFKNFAISTANKTTQPDVGDNNEGNSADAVTETEKVSNANITFELQFMNSLALQGGKKEAWSSAYRQPFIDASNQWLLSLRGVDNQPGHLTVKIKVRVKDLPNANGMAGPDSEVEVNGFNFPTSGEMIIGNHTYAQGFDQVEFKANIMHELGHIIGIGSFSEQFVSMDSTIKGNVFRLPAEHGASKAVAEYNRIYSNTLDYVPFSDNGGHLYDYKQGGDKKRFLADGSEVPSLAKEFMANGVVYGRVTLAVLDDMGYVVDYTNAEIYTP